MCARSWIYRSCLLVAFIASPLASAASTDNGVLTAGASSASSPNPVCPYVDTLTIRGYGGSVGSYSPTGLTGGRTVHAIYDLNSATGMCGTTQSFLSVTGFASNPGSSWLISITCNGVTRSAASASYAYVSSGLARWYWINQTFGFSNGTQVSCSIVHN